MADAVRLGLPIRIAPVWLAPWPPGERGQPDGWSWRGAVETTRTFLIAVAADPRLLLEVGSVR